MRKCEVPYGGKKIMRKEVKVVRDYWATISPLFNLDTEVLVMSVDSLETVEREILLNGDSTTDEDQHDEFIFVVTKVFNRHNDICSGVTEVKDGDVIISENSSITELNIELKTLRDCNRNAVYHISDISKEILPALSFEAIADVTGAVIAMGTDVFR